MQWYINYKLTFLYLVQVKTESVIVDVVGVVFGNFEQLELFAEYHRINCAIHLDCRFLYLNNINILSASHQYSY